MPITKEKNTKTKAQIIKIANTEIIIGNTYDLIPKKDGDAPKPLNGQATVKHQMPTTGEERGIPWDEEMRRWDTGFEVTSPCNRTIKAEDKESLVDIYNKYIKAPYEDYYQVTASATNDDFWADYLYEMNTSKSFDTKNPKDLFDLFHMLKQGRVCEVGERDAMLQRSAKYCIKNREKAISFQEERAKNKAKAIHTFMNMLDALDPKKDDTLYTILEWMNIPNIRGAEPDALERTVLKQFENDKLGQDNVDRFLEAYDMTKTDNGKKEMELFSMVSKLYMKNKLEHKRQQFYLQDTLLGNTLKGSAKSALVNPELKTLIISEYEKIA